MLVRVADRRFFERVNSAIEKPGPTDRETFRFSGTLQLDNRPTLFQLTLRGTP